MFLSDIKTLYDKLVAKVNSIDTSGFFQKTKHDRDKLEIESKNTDTRGFVKKTDYNAKITEIEGKIPSISGLATNAELRMLVQLRKQFIAQNLLKLKRNLLTITVINILQLQNLIFQLLMFLIQDQHKQIQ